MGFAAIYFLISLAVRAETSLQKFDKKVRQPSLLFPSALADRTVQTPLRFLPVFLSDY